MNALLLMLVLVPMALICLSDLRRRIIPDGAVVAIAMIGLLRAAMAGQPDLFNVAAVPSALAAGGVGVVFGAALAVPGIWGWGDAKLLAAGGTLTGVAGLPVLLMVMALVGGVFALALLLIRKQLLAGRWQLSVQAPRWLLVEQRRLRRVPTVPYGLAIVAGILAGM